MSISPKSFGGFQITNRSELSQGLLSLYCIYSLIVSDVVPFDARDKTVPRGLGLNAAV